MFNFKKQIHFSSDMGRMGNQMFQYACAKGLSYQHGFITSLSHLDQLAHFKLSLTERFFNKIKSTLFFRLAKPLFGLESINTQLKCMEQLYSKDLLQISKPTMVWGFFQSPIYFDAAKEKIKRHFIVKDKYRVDFEAFLAANHLEKGKYVAVHLRLTDYKGFTVPCLQGNDFTLPVSYYHNALAQLKELEIENLPIVFVSDDPEQAEVIFKGINDKIISRGSAITDFLVLQHSAHMIISNSTYAWWSAFLNPHNNVKVFCPQYFLGFKEDIEIPVSIYPEYWEKVSVY